jgi:hypothetical protein
MVHTHHGQYPLLKNQRFVVAMGVMRPLTSLRIYAPLFRTNRSEIENYKKYCTCNIIYETAQLRQQGENAEITKYVGRLLHNSKTKSEKVMCLPTGCNISFLVIIFTRRTVCTQQG